MKILLGRICAILLCAAMIPSFSACESGGGTETGAPASAKAVETAGDGKRVYLRICLKRWTVRLRITQRRGTHAFLFSRGPASGGSGQSVF